MGVSVPHLEFATMTFFADGKRFQIRPHSGDPGPTHLGSVSPGIAPVIVDPESFDDFEDDTSPDSRKRSYAASLVFAAEAGSTGQITHLTFWAASQPDIPNPTWNIWFRTVQLPEAVEYVAGQEVLIPAGLFEIFGSVI